MRLPRVVRLGGTPLISSGRQGVRGSNPLGSTGERNAGTLAMAGVSARLNLFARLLQLLPLGAFLVGTQILVTCRVTAAASGAPDYGTVRRLPVRAFRWAVRCGDRQGWWKPPFAPVARRTLGMNARVTPSPWMLGPRLGRVRLRNDAIRCEPLRNVLGAESPETPYLRTFPLETSLIGLLRLHPEPSSQGGSVGSNPIGATNQNPLHRKGFCAFRAENLKGPIRPWDTSGRASVFSRRCMRAA